MKLLRISASLMAFGMITALAACGGGGGGGGSLPNPGGGGGGPTPKPSTSPTSSPTATPTPTQTATPTPTSSPSGSTIQSNGHIVIVQDGSAASPEIFGTDNWQTNGVTDSSGGGADGDLAAGFTSSHTGPIDGVQCTLGTEPGTGQYHVHSFVGIYVNGTQYAIPDAIGLLNPSGDGANATAAFPNENFSQGCFMHTHSTSGIIHIEDTTLPQDFTSQPTQYNVQSLLDIWGQGSIANIASAAASFSGTAAVYLGTPCANNAVGCNNPQKNPANNDDLVTKYTLQSGGLSGVKLGHHVAVWIVVGAMPANGLPGIDFGLSN